jgi:putative radical SAM enzyme (TIGR03279 family)
MARGVRIDSVEPESAAHRAGIRAGDRLRTINGREVEDHLDVRFHASGGDLDLFLERDGSTIRLAIPEEEYPLRGLDFEEIRPKVCGSSCIFCFIDQLPPGVRPTLLVKDEDYRLSFLHGNYITLSTLRDREVERIVEQRLSPLYVSIHAVDDGVRATLLGRKPKRPLFPTLDRLLEAGIEVWGQVVLCPGLNDGSVLDETVTVLAERHPKMRGIAVVPVSISEHARPNPLLARVTEEIACSVLDAIEAHRTRLLERIGTRFVFAADEFYLKAGRPIPPASGYEEFGMLEDGIGMVRDFADRLRRAERRRRGAPPALRELGVVTGTLFGPVLRPLLEKIGREAEVRLPVVAVENRFLGKAINVAGLLAGKDVADSLRGAGVRAAAIPAEMVSRANGLLLDDYTPERVRDEGGVERIHVVDGADDLVRLIWDGAAPSAGKGTYGS